MSKPNKPSAHDLLKVKPPADYPPEEGHYLRGNDFSPVAVVVLLHTFYDKIPDYLNRLVKTSVEAGAALAGMLQTENIGLEKIICNVVANPNIRYVVLCGVESPGHYPGETFVALMRNGVDERRNIRSTRAPAAYLYNIPSESIERFRRQVTLVNLVREEDPLLAVNPELVKKAVSSCYQEMPTQFMEYTLWDTGAYPEPPICSKITWRIDKPWALTSEQEQEAIGAIAQAAKRKSEVDRKPVSDSELLDLLVPKKKAKPT